MTATTPADMGADAMSQIKPPLPEPAHTVKVWGLAEETYTAGQMHFYADTCTAALSARVAELERQVAQLTAERDEWARKAQEWRHKYAELRYPGMTQEVKELDAAIDAAMKEQT